MTIIGDSLIERYLLFSQQDSFAENIHTPGLEDEWT